MANYEVLGASVGYDVMSIVSSALKGLAGGTGGGGGALTSDQMRMALAEQQQQAQREAELRRAREEAAKSKVIVAGVVSVGVLAALGVVVWKAVRK